MVNPIQCANASVPLQYDILVSVTREASVTDIDLSQIIFCTPEAPLAGDLPIGEGRVRYYLTAQEVIDTYGSDSEAYSAAKVFFGQKPRPNLLGIGQIFTDPQAGTMKTGIVGTISAFQAVTDGSFTIVIDGVSEDITALDFSVASNYDDIAGIIEAALQAVGTGGYTNATVLASAITGSAVTFTFTSGTVGDGSTVSVLTPVNPAIGTDISASTYLNAGVSAASIQDGYTPTGLVGELGYILEASTCQGLGGFGFILDNFYADTQDQIDAADWALANNLILGIDTFNPLTIEVGNTSTNAYTLSQSGNANTFGIWSDTQEDLDAHVEYKAMGALALQLSWDTRAANSYIDISYKDIPLTTPTSVSTTNLNTLKGVNTNVLTTQGNGDRVIKYNYTYSNDWALDEIVAVLNMVKDIQIFVFTVFRRNKSVPFNTIGQAMIRQALASVGQIYVRNGSISDRVIEDDTQPSGETTLPAYEIIFPSLASVSAIDRSAKIYRGIQFIIQLSGTIHQVVINVEAQG